MVNSVTLVLNQSYEPVNLCRVRRAMILVFRGKAELLDDGRGEIHSASQVFSIPSVIRLFYRVQYPYHRKKVSRMEVFDRDNYTCQYCGCQAGELTLDHVIPRKRGGEHSWENVVSACASCNRRKGGNTPAEAGMRLLHKPAPPRKCGFHVPSLYLNTYEEWQKYLFR
jgi:5-methylcytosine-specific restriction endonuclease McrA